MPPRISRGSFQSAKPAKGKSQSGPRNPKKAQRRAQNAFSIAAHEAPDRTRIRKGRLGEVEGPTHRKRPRDEEEEDEDDEEEQDVKRGKRRRAGDESFDEGSDSEGNTWKMGHVEDDDDSDIDSDEAFGESDEERFEGWTFRGSSSNQKSGKGKKARPVKQMDDEDEDEDIDLDEGESADDEDEDEDDLGEDAIDLATALDQYEEDEEEEKREKQKKKKKSKTSAFDDSDEAPSEVGDFAADGASDFSSEDDDEDEADRRAQLKGLIASMAAEDEQNAPGPRKVDVHENAAPSEFGVMRKVDLAGFKSKIADPERRKSLKLLQDDKSTKRNDIARKLDAPLPKRQQDKIDRAAAAAKAKETLDRWTDTVKHNRRAEHLHFGPDQAEAGTRMGESRLLPTTTAEPANDLESTIQSILQQSGLSNGKEDEEKIQKWEELQTNKLPLAEVQKRRAQLRLERELMFREEVRAKRIKKIKSKSYRRVHRKERDRLMEKEREQLKADGIDVSEDEQEHNDRRRAEERMGAKHRESKWAKGVKASGRGAWDDDARAGVTEMARRNEELRRRIEGKEVRDEGDEASDFSSDEDDDDLDDDEEGNDAIKRQLGRLKQNPFSTDQSKLGSMAFMQKAEAARRARNDEDVERLRKELAGEESNSDGEDDNATKVGRRKFGPSTKMAPPAVQLGRSEFEEREQPDSDEENADAGREVTTNGNVEPGSASKASSGASNPYLKPKKGKKVDDAPDLVPMAYDTIAGIQVQEKPVKKSMKKSKSKQSSDESMEGVFADNPTISKPDDDGFQTVTYDNEDEDDDGWGDENDTFDATGLQRNQQLTASAFAGDNVEADFAAEKKKTIADEDEHIEENVLPGWGAWTGDGLTASEKRNKGQVTYTKKPGIAPGKRKDAKLARVIVNEKRVKANTKYMSSQLPFPFETKEQYERSLRLPKGPEWTTKKTFQQATKPRVLVKQGVIKPMHKPLV